MSDSKKPPSYQPTDGLSYDPEEPKYWDPAALREETERVFEVCNGCRLCFKYCDTFPTMFDLIDDTHGGDVTKLSDAEVSGVMSHCFQCKLCEVQCPYTPRDGHEFQLDFPKLVHRYSAQHTREHGVGFAKRMVANPNRLGKMARMSLGLANPMNRFGPNRWFIEKLFGIHRKKQLPDFARSTFTRWAKRQGKVVDRPGPEAVLFPTCFVDNNNPEIGRDTVTVLEKNGVEVGCVEGLACCGMPAWEHGDLETVRKNAARNLDILSPFVDAGAKVVAISPTCSMMMRREYPDLVAEADRERARKLAAAIVDPSELVWSLRTEERFNTDVKKPSELKVAYHAPCHLRAQGIGFRGRDLIRKLLGAQVSMVMECCGQDGTWSMTVKGFEPANRIGKKAFDEMKEADAPLWVGDCPLSHSHFQQNTGVLPLHPMTVLARAYRGEPLGFEVAGGEGGEEKK